MSSPAAKQTGLGNPAFRPEPSGRPGAVGIGKPAGSDLAGQFSRRPGSDEFSTHPDDRDLKEKQKKRMYIIMGVLGFLTLAFLIIAIVMIVLYVQEKDKPAAENAISLEQLTDNLNNCLNTENYLDPPQLTKADFVVKPFYFAYVDYNTPYYERNATKSYYNQQVKALVELAFPPKGNLSVPFAQADHIEYAQKPTETRRKRATGSDGFPDDNDFIIALTGQMNEVYVFPNITETTDSVCKTWYQPDPVPHFNETSTVTPRAPTTTSRPGSTVSGGTTQKPSSGPSLPPTITAGLTTSTSRGSTLSHSETPCPTAASCPTCPTSPTTSHNTNCPTTVCPTPTTSCPTSVVPTTTCPPSTCPTTRTPPTCPSCPTCGPATHSTTPYRPSTRPTIPYSTTTKGPVSDICRFDLIFIIDESESVGSGATGSENFKLIKKAMQDSIGTDIMIVSPDHSRVGWVGFSTETYTEANEYQYLSQAMSNGQSQSAMELISFHPGGSNAVSAFNYARDVLLTPAYGERPYLEQHKDLLILISDGNYATWDHPDPAYIPARQLLAKGVLNYAVAVAEEAHDVDFENLKKITGDERHVFNIQHYEQLGQKLKDIIRNITCPPAPIVCQGDLVLVVDRSESVGEDHFRDLQDFLVNLTGMFHVNGELETKISLVSFSRDVKVEFELDTFKNNLDIANYIRNDLIYYHPDATNTAGALETVWDKVLDFNNGDRVCVPDVVILFTDGIHDVGGDPAIPAAKLRKDKVVIVSVGIGPLVEEAELHSISDPTGRVYMFDDFTHLGYQFVDYVNELTCQPDPVLPRCNDLKDIVFVVDLHYGLQPAELQYIKDWLIYLADSFYMDDDSIHVSLVTYGHTVLYSNRLQHYSNAQFDEVIRNIQVDTTGGPPALADALKYVATTVFNVADDRDDLTYPDVVIIVETQPTDFSSDLLYWADQLTADGFTEILGVAGGDDTPYSAEVLRYIAGGGVDADRVISLSQLVDFETETCIDNTETKIIHDRTCGWYPPPPPPPTHCYQVCDDQPEPTTTTKRPTTTRGPPPSKGPTSPATTTPRPTLTTPPTTKTTSPTTSTSTPTTTKTTTRPIVRWACPSADLAFVVDVSDAPNKYIEFIKKFVSRLSELYMANSENTEVAIGIFSRNYSVVINFDQSRPWSNVNNAINNNWPPIPSIRDTKLGLQSTIEQILRPDPRPAMPDKVIVVDFGDYQEAPGIEDPFTVAETIRNRPGTYVYGFSALQVSLLKTEDPTYELGQIVNNPGRVKIFPTMNDMIDEENIKSLLRIMGCSGI